MKYREIGEEFTHKKTGVRLKVVHEPRNICGKCHFNLPIIDCYKRITSCVCNLRPDGNSIIYQKIDQ